MKLKILSTMIVTLSLGCLSACSGDNAYQADPTPTPVDNNDTEVTKELERAKNIELTIEGVQGVKAQNDFAFSVFKEISSDDRDENTLLSPLSLTTCVSMLANATSDEATQQIIEELMGNGVSLEKFNEVNEFLMSELASVDPTTKFTTSNSAWLTSGYSFLPAFEDAVKTHYKAQTSTLDLYSSSSADVINNWTNESTNGLIPTLFQNAPCADFVIANAIYFKAGWVAEFNPENTKRKNFTNINGLTTEVDMMSMDNAPFRFYSDDECAAVELPYGNKAFAFYAVLPDESIDFNSYLTRFDNDKWNKIFSNLHSTSVDVELPKFDASYDNYRLSLYMACHGLDKTFGSGCVIPNLANKKINGDLKCLQKNAFKVTETGAEGASVTSLIAIIMGEGGGGVSGRKPEIKLNRPFLYVVAEKSTGAIIFIGSVVKL